MSKKEEKQKQRIHREWWFDVEHAAEAEALLNDLAQQGWELESVGLQFAAFKRTEQGALRYACVPNHIDKTDVREDAREVFGKAGWTYILYNSQILVFCAPAGTETPEVPSDSPWARLGFAKRRSRNTAIRYGLLAAGLALLFFLSVRTHLLTDILLQVEFVIPIFVFYFITVLVLAAGAAKRYASLRKLAKRREGLYCTDRLYQKAVHRPKMLYRANLVIALLLLVSPFAYHANDTVAAGQNHLAVLSVADIVGGEKTESKGTPTTFYARHGFLYPEQLVSLEYAKWQGVYAKDKVVEDIALQYGACSARTPWLAALLADRLARYDDISGPYWFLDAPLLPQADAMGFDRLWGSVWRGGASTSIVALKGDVVYCVEISDANETVAMLAAALRAKIAQAKGP